MAFRAYLVDPRAATPSGGGPASSTHDDLAPGEVLVDVEWSAVNYKDAMVTVPGQPGGPDLTARPRGRPGRHGGRQRRPGAARSAPRCWCTATTWAWPTTAASPSGPGCRPTGWCPCPPASTPARPWSSARPASPPSSRSRRLETGSGSRPATGPVLVTGATGGVGSMAVALLARHGYEVVASTGKTHEHDYLRRPGGGRGRRARRPGRPTTAGCSGPSAGPAAVDCVGGRHPGRGPAHRCATAAAVAASGLTGGTALETTVYPFIVRDVSLLGVDSVNTPLDERRAVWADHGRRVPPARCSTTMVAGEIGLDGLDRGPRRRPGRPGPGPGPGAPDRAADRAPDGPVGQAGRSAGVDGETWMVAAAAGWPGAATTGTRCRWAG